MVFYWLMKQYVSMPTMQAQKQKTNAKKEKLPDVVEQLEATNVEKQVFSRGREFPKMVPLAKQIVQKDRKAVEKHDFERMLKE